MLQTENIKTLSAALVKVQAELKTLLKDKQGYGYKYSDLDTVISTVRPLLAKNNVGFMQSLSILDSRPALTTRLFNSEGEYIEDTIYLPAVELGKTNSAQNLGASITYMKRYALCSMLGISCDEDVDAASLTPAPVVSKATPDKKAGTVKKSSPAKWTEAEGKELANLLSSKNAEGKDIFTEEDKKKFREQLTVDGGAKTIESVKALLQVKTQIVKENK